MSITQDNFGGGELKNLLDLTQIKIKTEKSEADYGKFSIEPVDPGFAQILGNSLRRVLLLYLPGAAVTDVKIEGIRHQFSTLSGMSEDIIEFILNLKKVRLKLAGAQPVKLTLSVRGPKVIKAADLKCPAGVEIVNPEFILANLANSKSKIAAKVTVQKGEGYLPVEEMEKLPVGTIPVDALFSPVKKVNFTVSATRVGRAANFERLTLEIYTDGTIIPGDALISASKILVERFKLLYEPSEVVVEESQADSVFQVPAEILKTTWEELDLPTRYVNALKKKKITTVEDFLKTPKTTRMRIKNYGPKTEDIFLEKLKSLGVES